MHFSREKNSIKFVIKSLLKCCFVLPCNDREVLKLNKIYIKCDRMARLRSLITNDV